MQRCKRLIAGLAVAVGLSASLTANAQTATKIARIGVLTFGLGPASVPAEAFRGALRDHGYVEGKSVMLEYRFAEGQAERLPSLAAELVRLKVDVIVTEGTPTALAVKRATQTIPVVMAVVANPVGLGIVPSLSRPGGNITGLTFSVADRPGKQLQLLKETIPNINLVAVIHNSTRPDAEENMKGATAAAKALGLSLQFVGVKTPAELDASFHELTNRRPEAFISLGDGMLWGNRKRLVQLSAKNRLPAVFPEREFVEDGGLMSYGPDITSNFRRAAAFVDKILKGAKPADLPIEQPTKWELAINLKAAKALGVTIPPGLLVRADQIIE